MSFTKKQVSEIIDLSPRLIQYYTERGVVHPDVDEGAGRGNVRRYSKANLLQFSIIKELVNYHVAFRKIDITMKALSHSKYLTWEEGEEGEAISVEIEDGWNGMLKEGAFGSEAFIVLTEGGPKIWPFIVSTNNPAELGVLLFTKGFTGDASSLLFINLNTILDNIKVS